MADKPRLDRKKIGRLLSRLIGLARPEWKGIAVGSVFLLLGSAMGLAYPQAIRLIIDEALGAQNIDGVDRAAYVMMAIFLVQGIAVAFRHYLFTVAGERIVARLRAQLYHSIVVQEIGFFDVTRTGELTSRLSTDTTTLQNTVSVNISMSLRNAAAVVGGVALLFYTSPRLAALMLVVVPPLVAATLYFGRAIRRLARQFHDALARAGEVAEETIAGIRTVRAFAREAAEAERYEEAVAESFRSARRRVVYAALFSGAVSFAGYGAVALVLWYGGRLVLDDAMSVGDLTSFILYTLIVAFSLGALGTLWADFMRAAGAGERVFELMDRKAVIPATGGKTPDDVSGQLALERVTFAYPSRPDVTVLAEVDLTIEPDEVVALVGPSGGGKSTIARLIPRFYDPTAGRLLLDGRDLRTLDATWLRRQVGVVAQEPVLLSTTVAANIRYGNAGASDAAVEAAAHAANAHRFVNDFPDGYETLVGERGVQLSGGQKQRVAIARAVLKDPRVLILDEATSALDAESEFLVREALERLMRDRTTLIIAHRLSTVMGADRVVVVDEGRVVQTGSHAQLMDEVTGMYKRLIDRQFVAA